jgi:quercetin dioxygenase-like cupin family protein
VSVEVQRRREPIQGPANWFTGEVFIEGIAQGDASPLQVASVHFAPGARTAWHAHANGQTLYVTDGEGRVQARGEPVVTIRPGDVVRAPGGEWHWHGASPEHAMTHISMTHGDATWGDHVTDEEYRAGS